MILTWVLPYLNALQAFSLIFLAMPVSLRTFIGTFFSLSLLTLILKIFTTRT